MSPKCVIQTPSSSSGSFYRKRQPKNQQKQQQQLKWQYPSIDDIIKETNDEPTQSTTEYQLSDVTSRSLFELCCDRTRTTKRGSFVQDKVQNIISRYPDCIHTIEEKNGYNVLHVVCSNPTLNMNLSFIKLLVQTSVQCMDRPHIKGGKGNRSAHGRRGSMKNLSSLALSLSNHKGLDAPLVQQKSIRTGELPLHIACQNATSCSLDVLEYIIQCYPGAIWMKDTIKQNLPLHYLCTSCAEDSIPWDVVLLVVQQWPEACMIENKDGNLPLHLAAELHTQTNLRVQNFFESIFDTKNEADVVDTLEDIVIDDADDDSSYNEDNDIDDLGKENSIVSLYPDFQISAAAVTTVSRRKSTSSVAQGNLQKIISLFDEGRKAYEQEEMNRYEKQLEIIEYLVDVYPAAVHVKNSNGMTPLQVALKSFRAVANHRTMGKRQCGKILDFLERVTTANFPPPEVPVNTNNTESNCENTCSDDESSSDSSSYCSLADDSSQAPAPDKTIEEEEEEEDDEQEDDYEQEEDDEQEDGDQQEEEEEGGTEYTVTEEEKTEVGVVGRRKIVVQQQQYQQQRESNIGHHQDAILVSGIRSLNDVRRSSSNSLSSTSTNDPLRDAIRALAKAEEYSILSDSERKDPVTALLNHESWTSSSSCHLNYPTSSHNTMVVRRTTQPEIEVSYSQSDTALYVEDDVEEEEYVVEPKRNVWITYRHQTLRANHEGEC